MGSYAFVNLYICEQKKINCCRIDWITQQNLMFSWLKNQNKIEHRRLRNYRCCKHENIFLKCWALAFCHWESIPLYTDGKTYIELVWMCYKWWQGKVTNLVNLEKNNLILWIFLQGQILWIELWSTHVNKCAKRLFFIINSIADALKNGRNSCCWQHF